MLSALTQNEPVFLCTYSGGCGTGMLLSSWAYSAYVHLPLEKRTFAQAKLSPSGMYFSQLCGIKPKCVLNGGDIS